VGSITFCGSLSHADYDNNVSRIVRNVLTRFRDAERLNPGSDPAPWAADQPDARGL